MKTFSELPLIVLSCGLDEKQDWQVMQAELLQLSSHSQQLIPDKSGRKIELDQREEILSSLRHVSGHCKMCGYPTECEVSK